MERSLLWSALALGLAGYACCLAIVSSGRVRQSADAGSPIARPYVYAAVLLPILVFLLSLPSRAPFTAGQGFGRGFTLGALAALTSGFLAIRAAMGDRNRPLIGPAIVAGPSFLAAAAVCIPLLWMRGTVIDALAGIAIGWFSVALTLVIGVTHARSLGSALQNSIVTLTGSMGFTATAAAAASLGVYRGETAFDSGRYGAVAVILTASVPLFILICGLSSAALARAGIKTPFHRIWISTTERLLQSEEARAAAARGWRVALAAGLFLILAWLLSAKALTQPHLWHVAAVGIAATIVVWWLRAEGAVEGGPPQFLPVAVFVMLGAAAVAFNLMAGFGVAVMTLTAWLTAGMAQSFAAEDSVETGAAARPESSGVSDLQNVVLFATVLVLYRLVTSRFEDDLRGVGLTDQFAIFGFLAGAMLPSLLARLQPSRAFGAPPSPARQIARLIVAGILTLAVPGLILVLWKSKCALAMLGGLAVATVLAPMGDGHRDPVDRRPVTDDGPNPQSARRNLQSAVPLFALGVALALSQWCHHALLASTLTRVEKIHLLEWVIAGIALVILVVDYGERIAGRLRQIPTSAARQPVSGGAAK